MTHARDDHGAPADDRAHAGGDRGARLAARDRPARAERLRVHARGARAFFRRRERHVVDLEISPAPVLAHRDGGRAQRQELRLLRGVEAHELDRARGAGRSCAARSSRLITPASPRPRASSTISIAARAPSSRNTSVRPSFSARRHTRSRSLSRCWPVHARTGEARLRGARRRARSKPRVGDERAFDDRCADGQRRRTSGGACRATGATRAARSTGGTCRSRRLRRRARPRRRRRRTCGRRLRAARACRRSARHRSRRARARRAAASRRGGRRATISSSPSTDSTGA